MGNQDRPITLEDGSALDLYVDPEEHAELDPRFRQAMPACNATPMSASIPTRLLRCRPAGCTLSSTRFANAAIPTSMKWRMDSVHATRHRQAAIAMQQSAAIAILPMLFKIGWTRQPAKTLPVARQVIPETCAQCHNAIYQKYQESVHGSAL